MTETITISPKRLRIGIVLLFLWWLPFWLLQPIIATVFGIESAKGKSQMLIGILLIQTVLGLLGLFIVGKQVAMIVKGKSIKRMFPTVWHALIRGEIE